MINYALSCPWNILNMYKNHTCMIAHLYIGLVFCPKVDVFSSGVDIPRQTMGDRVVGGRHKTDVTRD